MLQTRKKKIEKKTINLFSKLHAKQAKEKKIYKRLYNLLSHKFFNVNKSFFTNKICLDAGCGMNANATYNFLRMGAKFVHACDINSKAVKFANNILKKKYKGKYKIRKSNLTNLSYKKNYFDFVHCAGAVHHTVNYKKAIKELCRVVKKEGYIYIEAYGKGGIIRDFTNILRKKYKDDNSFALLVNRLNKKKILDFCKFSLGRDINKIANLIDNDLILTIKDRICSPIYSEFDDKEIVKILQKNNFYKIKRLKRNPEFTNIRKYLAPFYFHYNHKYSKFLYGSGIPCIYAKKK